MSNGTTIDFDKAKAQATEKALDHLIDGVAALGIVAVALGGAAERTVVLGLVSIALGKRVLKSAAA